MLFRFLRRPSAWAVLAAVWLATGPVRAESPSISIVEHGIYATEPTGELEEAPRTATGSTRPVNWSQLERETERVFGQPGQSFGVRINMDGFPPGVVNLTIRTVHPPLTNPETGRTTTVSEYDWPVSQRRNVYFGYSFDHRWEIAEGDWVFQFIYQGRVLAEKRFRVVVPLN